MVDANMGGLTVRSSVCRSFSIFKPAINVQFFVYVGIYSDLQLNTFEGGLVNIDVC